MVKEPIFVEVTEVSSDALDQETIQEWIDVSKEYQERDEIVFGMHCGECDSADEHCCEMCENGHNIVTTVSTVDGTDVVAGLGCTTDGCTNQFL